MADDTNNTALTTRQQVQSLTDMVLTGNRKQLDRYVNSREVRAINRECAERLAKQRVVEATTANAIDTSQRLRSHALTEYSRLLTDIQETLAADGLSETHRGALAQLAVTLNTTFQKNVTGFIEAADFHLLQIAAETIASADLDIWGRRK